MSSVKKLAVIGAGQMGGGIAQVAASIAKIPSVIIFDAHKDQLKKRLEFISTTLSKDVGRGKITEAVKNESLERLHFTDSLHDIKECDFIIEAVPEVEALKTQIFTDLGSILQKDSTIVASNTSSISITKLAASFKSPANFIGMHFMNPVPVMKLVELISGKQTSPETLQVTRDLATAMGKTSTVSEDIPGFIVNRLLMPYINEAIFALYEVHKMIQSAYVFRKAYRRDWPPRMILTSR